MSSSEPSKRTIDAIDTELPADSVEFCPRIESRNILVCGTYNLVKNKEEHANPADPKQPQTRNGQCLVYEFGEAAQRLSYDKMSPNPVLALAESVGSIRFYEWQQQERKLSIAQVVHVGDAHVLCLSIDWNNRILCPEAQSLVVSKSDGTLSTLKPRESQMEVDMNWHAHDFECWIAAWNYWTPHVVYSGGDDCRLKGWDTRISCDSPIFINKRFEAGVTSVQTHPFVEHIVAVGSYDSTVRIFDSRKMTSPLVDVEVGGGAWRVKWHPLASRKEELLVACMHDGFKVIRCPVGDGVLTAGSTIVTDCYNAHTSLAYGVDWQHGVSNDEDSASVIASCLNTVHAILPVRGIRQLAAAFRQHMSSSATLRPSHRPSKRLHKTTLAEGESQLGASSGVNHSTAHKRLRRSESSESLTTVPASGARRVSTSARLSHREQESHSMVRGSERSGRGGGRYFGRGGRPRSEPKSSSSLLRLDGPVHDEAYLRSRHENSNLAALKPQWLENPKSTVSNYRSLNFAKQPVYEATEGMVEGRKMHRCSVVADENANIVGVGDAIMKKDAEKLAALSAMFQLHAHGLLDKSKKSNGASAVGTSSNVKTAASAGAPKLRDDTVVTFELARQFMDFYCKEFQYDPPEVVFESSARGSRTAWDATMTVGGRRIGLGYAPTKKEAKNNCYIDVTQYLDRCDDTLWPKFQSYLAKKGPDAEPGMAAKVHFVMSDDLDDEIRDLCRDIKRSKLYANSPASRPSREAVEDEKRNTTKSGIYRAPRPDLDAPTERYHEAKSTRMREGREAYESDSLMDQMRKTRRSLPVYTRAKDLLAEIERHDVTICMAATGSGKTTQVPQLILDQMIELGRGSRCNIVCTQPRRIAAISVAERVAKERGEPLGQSVGYQVRFEAKLPQDHGSITFCTTGIFLKRMQSALLERSQGKQHGSGPSLDDVTHILVDEVHERDVDTDLLLVVLKRLLADRRARQKPLKIILMSATIDPTLFQTYFAEVDGTPAPVAEVPGRSFPVTKYYMDDIIRQLSTIDMHSSMWVWQDKSVVAYAGGEIGPQALAPITHGSDLLAPHPPDPPKLLQYDPDIPYPLVGLTIAHVIKKSSDGHVLVFLPGWDEMMALQRILEDRRTSLLGVDFTNRNEFSLHLLHSTVPVSEQQAVFEPAEPGVRRIILATNIAETSITIPDVVYVVDTGRIKEKRYDPARHMSSLVTAWVGSSNLGQRAGRAGRHRSGEYYGIISKARVASLDPYQLVEMKRTDLTNVVMHVKAINFPGIEVEQVLAETIEPPEPERVASAMQSLKMVGALDDRKNLTSLGRVLLQLPVEVAMGRLVLYGSFFKCLDQALTLAAILTNRDPFMAPIALKQEANAAKERWSPTDFRSDALATLNAYNAWWAMQDRGEYVPANRFCSENFLSKPTLLMVQRIKGHLLQSLYHAGVLDISAGGGSTNYRAVREMVVPPELNINGDSKPLLAALIAIACQPNFAIRHNEKTYRTAQDKTAFIHPGSVNHRKRQAIDPHKDLMELGEREMFAFTEKTRSGASTDHRGQLFLRGCTRLDPMTYMLFGAYDIVVTHRGLECDNWLPIMGNIDALDDVQQLKKLMEACMLRVFDGICGRMGNKDKDYRSRFRIRDDRVSGTDEEAGGSGTPLSEGEIKELDYLTGDIVRILNRYSEERLSRQDSRWNSRPGTPSGYSTPPYFGGPGSIRLSVSGTSTPNPGYSRLGPRSAYFDSRPSTRPSSPYWR